MYRLELDLIVRFVPPMDKYGRGIHLTRTVELPFLPSEHIALHSRAWEYIDDPLGYRLKEIVWDADQNLFLAHTELSDTGTPVAFIPHEIRNLLEHGWAYGSFRDSYSADGRRNRKRKKLTPIPIEDWDWDEAETWQSERGRKRPAEFDTVWKSIIHTMAELYNNMSVAYAMQKTGTYQEIPQFTAPNPAERNFKDKVGEFEIMPLDDQMKWRDGVLRRFPRLIDVVEAIR